jgi:radical SAM protein with 4Fe4S-binding SPASM domain
METADSYPALLDFLKEQDFADQLSKVAFKPVIREPKSQAVPTPAPASTSRGNKFIALTAVSDAKGLSGACMSSAGAAVSSTGGCDSCHQLDDQMSFLREETRKRGFPTVDGVHMGPCEIHRSNAHTISPDGSLFACPGFAGDATQSIGHIDGRVEDPRAKAASRFDALAAWEECNGCAFIPVCAGGCTVAAYTELGTINKPNCHKPAIQAGLVALAHRTAAERSLATVN